MAFHDTASTKSWLAIAATFGLLSTVSAANAADVGDGYVNPCSERGTADQLNALYNDPVGPNEKCSTDDGRSYKCSGILTRGGLGRVRTYEGKGGIADFPNLFGIEDPKYTIGVGNLTSAVCPPDIVDDEEYPGFCPDPTHIYVGSMSFSYLRRDIAPPISILQQWEDTGIEPISGLNPPYVPTVGWPGGGFILMQEDTGYSNPDVVLPTNEDGEPYSSFWEFDRMGAFFPMDGASFGRTMCGDGPHTVTMYLGVSGPIVDLATSRFIESNLCPPYAAGWENLALPQGYEKSCSASTLSSVENYYDNWLSNVDTVFNGIDCSSEVYQELTEESCRLYKSVLLFNIQATNCGIPPESFDYTMIPVVKKIPMKVLYENLDTYGISPNTTFNFGLWNEATIKAWNGIGLPDLASALIFWYDETEGSKELAHQRAKEFYYASGVNGGTNIRIPVVYRDNRQTFNDPEVEYSELFSCPIEDDDDDGDVSDGDVSASNKSSSLSLLLSTASICALALISAAM